MTVFTFRRVQAAVAIAAFTGVSAVPSGVVSRSLEPPSVLAAAVEAP
ncbi:MAG: hypothetical protein U0528_07790 [Anaerolineae bacterium]